MNKKIFKNKSASWNVSRLIGLLTLILFLLTIVLSTLVYGNYNFFEQNLSELGVGSTAIIFNIGLMLSALLLIVFYYFILFKESKTNFLVALFSAIGFFGIGLFPLTLSFLHYVSAGIFFVLSAILIAKIVIDNKMKTKKIDFVGIFSLVLIIIYLALFQTPLMQKIAIIGIIIWLISKVFYSKTYARDESRTRAPLRKMG